MRNNAEKSFLRMKDMESYCGVSRVTIWNWIQQGKFPKGNVVSGRIRVWPRELVDQAMCGEWKREAA
jgi:predicted DNA-binding transcriptional regulator AlpA